MTEKTRIGLVLAMIFIVGFAALLTEFREPDEPISAEQAVSIDNNYTAPQLPTPVQHRRPAVRPTVRREAARETVRPVERVAQVPVQQPAPQAAAIQFESATMRLPERNTPPAYRKETVNQFGRRMARVDQQRQQQNTQPATRYYTVRSGDNLRKIARKTMRDDREWRNIYKANRDQLRDPDMLEVGMKLKIPS